MKQSLKKTLRKKCSSQLLFPFLTEKDTCHYTKKKNHETSRWFSTKDFLTHKGLEMDFSD